MMRKSGCDISWAQSRCKDLEITLLNISDPYDYTVDWICAITTEHHEGPESVSLNDNNDYALGKIGKYNIVIAVLPNREYSILPAISVARDMLYSFPNIRISLMVGIGGGAPSPKHDIRLGDIGVSASGGGRFGGVLHEWTQGPLREERHQFAETINMVLEKNLRLQGKYKLPEAGADRLFKSEVTHDLSCAATCNDDVSNLVLQPERTEDKDNPAIHYDRLSEEKEVLCFEIEAARLINHFPCLVIGGICNYSDSYKNKE
ncbi:hypothetical protein DER46DRAFT_623644 [Fusarium sp. MPI-SDFR-AT-0072]|nr:hypothetical protein DER46DRAFT_623644 [Fusarium sp. MPI-SDFR-AT-0072]